MTTDIEKCRRILETIKRTGNHLTITFNYRYNPVHELVKRTLAQGRIGKSESSKVRKGSHYAYSY